MIRSLNYQEFDRIYDIMEESFPLDERREREEQRDLLLKKEYEIIVACEGDTDEIVSFIALWRLDNFTFIEHFATAEDHRGRGVGGALLDYVIERFGSTVCLEVEPPESEIQKRRIEMYGRHGFFLNEYPYIQPPISCGRTPVPLMIMTTGGKIDAGAFESIKERIYDKVYNVRA